MILVAFISEFHDFTPRRHLPLVCVFLVLIQQNFSQKFLQFSISRFPLSLSQNFSYDWPAQPGDPSMIRVASVIAFSVCSLSHFSNPSAV